MIKPAPSAVAAILALVYFVWPVDLIPDLFGPVGRIDDLLVFALVAWQAYTLGKKRGKQQQGGTEAGTPDQEKSPHEVLGVEPNASQEEIDARYRQLAQQYHPDKVNHLGDELKAVAHEKMLEITRAYKALRA